MSPVRPLTEEEIAQAREARVRESAESVEVVPVTPETCVAKDHNPPTSMIYAQGSYDWTCPVCGAATKFTVRWSSIQP